MAIVSVLAALLLPALVRGKDSAKRIQCVNNLRQLGFAAQMYWEENGGSCFRYRSAVTNGDQLLWCGWLGAGAEGERTFDATQGPLYPYLRGHNIGLCPSFSSFLPQFKLKATGLSYGYGYNASLGKISAPQSGPPVNVNRITRPVDLALFADAAQINDFQYPASPSNPMLEEFYYIDTSASYPNGHFRHAQRANVFFCDGHVGLERMVPGSLDSKLPGQFVGRLRTEILVMP